jgi:hypothetical protein
MGRYLLMRLFLMIAVAMITLAPVVEAFGRADP